MNLPVNFQRDPFAFKVLVDIHTLLELQPRSQIIVCTEMIATAGNMEHLLNGLGYTAMLVTASASSELRNQRFVDFALGRSHVLIGTKQMMLGGWRITPQKAELVAIARTCNLTDDQIIRFDHRVRDCKKMSLGEAISSIIRSPGVSA